MLFFGFCRTLLGLPFASSYLVEDPIPEALLNSRKVALQRVLCFCFPSRSATPRATSSSCLSLAAAFDSVLLSLLSCLRVLFGIHNQGVLSRRRRCRIIYPATLQSWLACIPLGRSGQQAERSEDPEGHCTRYLQYLYRPLHHKLVEFTVYRLVPSAVGMDRAQRQSEIHAGGFAALPYLCA